MPSLLDSGKIVGSPGSVRDAARRCGTTAPISVRSLIDASECIPTTGVRLHLKVLTAPTIAIATMLARMREVYDAVGIRVIVASREELTGDAFAALTDIDIGECAGDKPVTSEQTQLFANRKDARDDEIVVYFVNSTNPAKNGCGRHPDNQPGTVLARIASRWTLAHEVGHVLGLSHISGEKDDTGKCVKPDTTRLMTGCSTDNITGTPTLANGERDTMHGSALTNPC